METTIVQCNFLVDIVDVDFTNVDINCFVNDINCFIILSHKNVLTIESLFIQNSQEKESVF